MKAFRSSPFRAFALASALHFVIFSCCVTGSLGVSPFKHVENAWAEGQRRLRIIGSPGCGRSVRPG